MYKETVMVNNFCELSAFKLFEKQQLRSGIFQYEQYGSQLNVFLQLSFLRAWRSVPRNCETATEMVRLSYSTENSKFCQVYNFLSNFKEWMVWVYFIVLIMLLNFGKLILINDMTNVIGICVLYVLTKLT